MRYGEELRELREHETDRFITRQVKSAFIEGAAYAHRRALGVTQGQLDRTHAIGEANAYVWAHEDGKK